MKLLYKPIEKEDAFRSIHVKRVHEPYVKADWHFHKEFELIYFIEGQGMRIVGDHISHFHKGELVLVGEWIPHLWRNDSYIQEENDPDYVIVKFTKDFEGVDLFSLPELKGINQLLLKSYRGILFSEDTCKKAHDMLIQMSTCHSIELLIYFLRILKILSEEQNYRLLSNPHLTIPAQFLDEDRLKKVINYIANNYSQKISLEDVSKIAFMTPPSFCRYFKSSTNKTFFQFLNEYRVNKACQLLINGKKPIKQVCYEVGFNSLTNFNRTFRSFKGSNPSAYRDNYLTLK